MPTLETVAANDDFQEQGEINNISNIKHRTDLTEYSEVELNLSSCTKEESKKHGRKFTPF